MNVQPGMVDASQPDTNRSLVIKITPISAFAVGALAAAGLALAFSLGRHCPPTRVNREAFTIEALEQVRQRPPLRYEQLKIDRGYVP